MLRPQWTVTRALPSSSFSTNLAKLTKGGWPSSVSSTEREYTSSLRMWRSCFLAKWRRVPSSSEEYTVPTGFEGLVKTTNLGTLPSSVARA